MGTPEKKLKVQDTRSWPTRLWTGARGLSDQLRYEFWFGTKGVRRLWRILTKSPLWFVVYENTTYAYYADKCMLVYDNGGVLGDCAITKWRVTDGRLEMFYRFDWRDQKDEFQEAYAAWVGTQVVT